jgi:predicted dehydrogenase
MLEREELDAVVVCTPNVYHVEAAIAALQRGLHVFVEKPLALTHHEAQLVVQAAQQANRTLTVGYNARGMGSWRRLKQLITAGDIGQLRQINVACCLDARFLWQAVELAPPLQGWMSASPLFNALLGDALRPGAWRRNPAVSGGMLVEVGTHLLDLALWLADSPAATVIAWQQAAGNELASIINAQFSLANEVTVSLTFNDTVEYGDFNLCGHGHLTCFGDGGVLAAEWSGYMATEAQSMWMEQCGVRQVVEPLPTTTTPVEAFVATVLDGVPNLAPVEEAAQTVALTEAIFHRGDFPFDCSKAIDSAIVKRADVKVYRRELRCFLKLNIPIRTITSIARAGSVLCRARGILSLTAPSKPARRGCRRLCAS